jgi:hypothetical protein
VEQLAAEEDNVEAVEVLHGGDERAAAVQPEDGGDAVVVGQVDSAVHRGSFTVGGGRAASAASA